MYHFCEGDESDPIHKPDWRLTAVTCGTRLVRCISRPDRDVRRYDDTLNSASGCSCHPVDE